MIVVLSGGAVIRGAGVRGSAPAGRGNTVCGREDAGRGGGAIGSVGAAASPSKNLEIASC